MRALVLQHIAVEGPGVLALLLAARGWQVQTVPLYAGVSLPASPGTYQAIIVMGGPMSVHDEATHAFLRQEHDFLRRAVAEDVPLLGICLGSQLLAKALGARVYRNHRKEIGWYTVDLTVAGQADPLFADTATPVRVFQWHGDAFELPVGAVQLATSVDCTNQAFRYRDNVYGLLFHLELTPQMIRTWLVTFRDELAGVADEVDPARIEADIERYIVAYEQVRSRIFTHLIERLWEPRAGDRRMDAGVRQQADVEPAP